MGGHDRPGGGILGAIIAPWLTTRPAAWLSRTIRELSAVQILAGFVGLGLGLIVAALAAIPLSYLPFPFSSILPTLVALFFGYLGITTMTLHQRDFFAFFTRRRADAAEAEERGQPAAEDVLLLDTSVIIDGRIADVARTGFIRASMLIPRFVLAELQYIADSPDSLRRNRGRRGLEMLDRLQQNPDVHIEFIDVDPQDAQQVDDKLISLARDLGGAIITNDYNLNRVARLQGVKVLNINELANAVKSVFLPGEGMPIKIIQVGKEIGQGVGYLEDGTMVVIENGRRYMDSDIEVSVTKVLQTNAGRMIFASPAH